MRTHIVELKWRYSALLALGLVMPMAAWVAPAAEPKTAPAAIERKASRMIDAAEELLQMGHEERGMKMIAQVPRMYPEAKARYRAHLLLGQHLSNTGAFEKAIKSIKPVFRSEDLKEQAEAHYRIGICYYSMNDFSNAFMSLRRVTNEFPESVYANEAFYYIGLCHFRQKRWTKAVEALRMVGTRVPENDDDIRYVEAGQRLFIKVEDKDLVVLLNNQKALMVEVSAQSGDRETIDLTLLGRSGETYVGSIPSQPGKGVVMDGVLDVRGGDNVTVTYTDENTAEDKRNQVVLAKLKIVSTGTLNFMDGAYKEVTSVVPTDQPTYVQLKDLDLDTSAALDRISVQVVASYQEKEEDREIDPERHGIDLEHDEVEWVERSRITLVLTETGPHTGLFQSTFLPQQTSERDDGPASSVSSAAGQLILPVLNLDRITMTYGDERHINGEEERDVVTHAPVVIGRVADVKSPVYDVNDPTLKARKLLIEGEIFLEWGTIFKEVGLVKKASEKADEGLDRIEQVMTTYAKLGFDRDLVEQAFKVKWELLLLQDKLAAAINTCRQLTILFPDTLLADDAFLRIGQARMLKDEYTEAITIFQQVMALPNADVKAEAQYNIGVSLEEMAIDQAALQQESGRGDGKPKLAPAMLAYKKCADLFPQSPFAGESLQKMVTYYLLNHDYARATQMVEMVMQDYQDASWLDAVLLKGAIAAYRAQNFPLAKAWFQKIVEEYSESKSAEKAQKFLVIVRKKIGDAGEARTE